MARTQAFEQIAKVVEQLGLGEHVKEAAKHMFAKYRDRESRVKAVDVVLAASVVAAYAGTRKRVIAIAEPEYLCERCQKRFINPR